MMSTRRVSFVTISIGHHSLVMIIMAPRQAATTKLPTAMLSATSAQPSRSKERDICVAFLLSDGLVSLCVTQGPSQATEVAH